MPQVIPHMALFLFSKVNYHPLSGWLDFEPLKGGEKSKGTSVPVALPQGTTTREAVS